MADIHVDKIDWHNPQHTDKLKDPNINIEHKIGSFEGRWGAVDEGVNNGTMDPVGSNNLNRKRG